MCSCTKRVPYRLASGPALRLGGPRWIRTNIGCVCGLFERTKELQRKESNLRMGRLTAGCLTTRLRWKMCSSRTYVRAAAVSTCPISCEAERRSGQRVRTRRALAPSCQRARDPRARGRRFRAQDSNLSFWVQRPVSCQLDDPGAGDGVASQRARARRRAASFDAAVGPEGIEPSPPRVRAGCASSCATDLGVDESSRVLGRCSCVRFVRERRPRRVRDESASAAAETRA